MKKINTAKPDVSIFKNLKSEAKFWENNFDLAWKKGKGAKVKFARNLSDSINIRLDPNTLMNIRAQAKRKGLGPTQLIRMWIMEKISAGSFSSAG